MPSLASILSTAHKDQVIDMGGASLDGGTVLAPAPGVTLRNVVLTSGLSVYKPDGWEFDHITRDGLQPDGSFAHDEPKAGAGFGIAGGTGWLVHNCDFRNLSGYSDLSVGTWNYWDGKRNVAVEATKWNIEDCTFGAHTQLDANGKPILPKQETAQQQHSLYIHNDAGSMGGTIRNLTFEGPNHGGSTVKLGGVNDSQGRCTGVDIDGLTFTGYHEGELLLVSASVTMKNVTSSAPVAGRPLSGGMAYSVYVTGSGRSTIAGPPLPCGTLLMPLATPLENWLTFLKPKPVIALSGKSVMARGNGLTWSVSPPV